MPTKIIPNLVVQRLGDLHPSHSMIASLKSQPNISEKDKSKADLNAVRSTREKAKLDSLCSLLPPNLEAKNSYQDLTPKKRSQMRNKVTPGTDRSSKKRKPENSEVNESSKPPPQKKQRSLLSFFSKSTTKSEEGSRSSKNSSNSSFCLDKESFRDIVLGSIDCSLPSSQDLFQTPVNYDKQRGSPLPNILKQPLFNSLNTQSRKNLIKCIDENDALAKDSGIQAPESSTRQEKIAFHSASQVSETLLTDSSTPPQDNKSCHHSNNMMNDALVNDSQDVKVTLVDLTQQDEPLQDDEELTVVVQECIVDLTQPDLTQKCTQDKKRGASEMAEKIEMAQSLVSIPSAFSKIESSELNNPDFTVEPNENRTHFINAKSEQHLFNVENSLMVKDKGLVLNEDCSSNGYELDPQRILDRIKVVRENTLRRQALLNERVLKGVEEESVKMPAPSGVHFESFEDELSRDAVMNLAYVVQGSDLSLTAISKSVRDVFALKSSAEYIAEKIKTYFSRECYLTFYPLALKSIDKFEDTGNRMWRWEIISPDVFSDELATRVKRSQTARKKIRSYSKSLSQLLQSLDDAEKMIHSELSSHELCESAIAKVNACEEYVLKFERANEKARLLEEAKLKKEEIKRQSLLDKERMKTEKEKDSAAKRELEAKCKAETLKRKQEEKQRKKEEQLERKRKEEDEKRQTELNKNRSRLLNFFVSKVSSSKEEALSSTSTKNIDEDRLWKSLNSRIAHSQKIFEALSTRALKSRMKRGKKVPVAVYVTNTPDDPFSGEQPYAELRTMVFSNRYKFLSFHEDFRPAYHGTWSKKSNIIKGKTPFSQDIAVLNYDEDSEAEWEEGDDELGEDVQDENADDEEENIDPLEGDTRNYNFQDGWMADDDEVIYEHEEVDDESKKLRKRLKSKLAHLSEEIIAPMDGRPILDVLKETKIVDLKPFFHSNEERQSDPLKYIQQEMMQAKAEVLSVDDVCIEAYAPNQIDDSFVGDPTLLCSSGSPQKPIQQEMSTDDMKVFASFVHHSLFPSKDRLIEEFRSSYPSITSSRAQAVRKLDSIALKKKNPTGGVIWEVKRNVLEDLGLQRQLDMPFPESTPKRTPETSNQNAESLSTRNLSDSEVDQGKLDEKVRHSAKKRKTSVSGASAELFARFIEVGKKTKSFGDKK